MAINSSRESANDLPGDKIGTTGQNSIADISPGMSIRRAVRLHERSRFERAADVQRVPRWWYVDGDQI